MLAALACAVTASAPASAEVSIPVAEFNRIMPPPGLYQIDSDGLLNNAVGSFRQTEDGASGDVSTRITSGGSSHQRDFKGNGQRTYCMPPRPPGAVTLPPAMAGNACKSVSTKVEGDSIVQVAQCATGPVTNTIRKLGGDQWEITTQLSMTTAPGAPDLNNLRPLLEQMARNGTPEERAKASKTLAELPQLQSKINAGHQQVSAEMAKAEAGARTPEEAAQLARARKAMQQPGAAMSGTGRQHWIRIGGSCAAQAR